MSDLSHVSDEATQQTNTTGEQSSILDFQPEEGRQIVLHPSVGSGDEPGIPIYGTLQDTNGNDLPLDTLLQLVYDKRGPQKPKVVTEPKTNIRPYRTHPVTDQDDEDRIDSFKHKLRGIGLIVRHIDTMSVEIDSSAQIDWANSELYIDENAVQETPAGVNPFAQGDGGR